MPDLSALAELQVLYLPMQLLIERWEVGGRAACAAAPESTRRNPALDRYMERSWITPNGSQKTPSKSRAPSKAPTPSSSRWPSRTGAKPIKGSPSAARRADPGGGRSGSSRGSSRGGSDGGTADRGAPAPSTPRYMSPRNAVGAARVRRASGELANLGPGGSLAERH